MGSGYADTHTVEGGRARANHMAHLVELLTAKVEDPSSISRPYERSRERTPESCALTHIHIYTQVNK